jgi:hypothetical protein
MIPLLASVLGASLLGSPHCAGMCGGFVCFYTGTGQRVHAGVHLAYNLGRLAAYAALGTLAGLTGGAFERVLAPLGIPHAAAVLAGVLMTAWGGLALLRALGLTPPARAPGGGHRPFAALVRRVHAQPPVMRASVVGLVTALLPCGWLWAFVATAAGAGSAAGGALVMAAFWLGTLPVMTAVGIAAQGAFGPLRQRLPVLTAALLVVLGLLTVSGRFHHVTAGPGAVRCAHDGR